MEGIRSGSWPLPSRADLVRALFLVLLTCLLWCAIYHRWTAASWQTPLEYLTGAEKADVLQVLADIEAARDGHFTPLFFTNVPQLGAPYDGNWNDYPMPEKPLVWLTGLLARVVGLFAAANFAVMLGQVLAAVSFYAAARLLGASWPWAFAGGLAFAFSRFAFAHSLHHLFVLWYWHVPLCLVVCAWLLRGDEELRLGEGRFFFAQAIAFVTGIQNIYYTSVFVQFLAWGGVVQIWRRGPRSALPAATLIMTAMAALFLMNANTLIYHFLHGPDPDVVQRAYSELETYGLKLVDLVTPPPDHRWPWLAAWGSRHLQEVLLPPGEVPPAGYLGIAGLAALGWLVAVSIRCVLEGKRVPLETWMILWLMLEGSVGGLNGILGAAGFVLFRATSRYTIFILALVLLFAARRLAQIELRNKFIMPATACLLALLALADQTPPIASSQIAATARDVTNDRDFARALEARLGPGGMIFQLPVMDFPESPVPGVFSYNHLRLYLYSNSLRFSFGSDKGRPREEWQKAVFQASLPQGVQMLESYGFGAIYVNRNGFADRGASLETEFKAAGLTDQIDDAAGDLFCVFLKPSPTPVLPPVPAD